ncbi:MAG: carboxypeptidase regulatory-like domain-containing protein, partial [Planctomycetaceae bacterium]|nr:carboxypeptidase regulatory-like domain-containing protein [Planctomycetaceae bacterium]
SAGGKITLDGRPLPNAVVTFEASDGTYSYAMTDSDGEYELQFDSEMEGVRPGPKTVRISTTRKLLGLNVAEGDDPNATGETEQGKPKAIQKPQELVPTRYNEESELTVEVTPDEKTYNFDLTTSA